MLSVLAFCVAVTVYAVQAEDGPNPADALAQAVALDMRQWWTPTAQTYLSSVPAARIIEVVREAVSPEVAAPLEKLKKGPLTHAAEQRLAGTGWLPPMLRTSGSPSASP